MTSWRHDPASLEVFDDRDDEELLDEELRVEDRDVRRSADDGVGRVARQRVMDVVPTERHVGSRHDRWDDVVNHLAVRRTCKSIKKTVVDKGSGSGIVVRGMVS